MKAGEGQGVHAKLMVKDIRRTRCCKAERRSFLWKHRLYSNGSMCKFSHGKKSNSFRLVGVICKTPAEKCGVFLNLAW